MREREAGGMSSVGFSPRELYEVHGARGLKSTRLKQVIVHITRIRTFPCLEACVILNGPATESVGPELTRLR